MWPILGPIECGQTHRSTSFPNFENFQYLFFGSKSPEDQMIQNSKNNSSTSTLIISNIRYIDPISLKCLVLYSLILLLLCALPILALNIYLRQAFVTFHQTSQLQVDY